MGSLSDYFNRVMNGPPFRPGEEMKYEAIRLGSFKEWPHWAHAQPTLLAKAGFYFTGTNDEVCCFSCQGKIKEWQKGDDPTSEHRRWFPECPYVSGQASENVPLEASTTVEQCIPNLGSISLESQSRNFGNNQDEASTLAGSQLNSRQRSLEHGDAHAGRLASLNSSTYQYRFEENRLKSFVNWPSRFMAPEALAKAGFYFLGDFDRVQCAFCRGILRNWEPGDSAFDEHKKHFPDCPFVCERDVGNVAQGLGVQGATARPVNQAVSLRKEKSVATANLGIVTERPKHPDKAILEHRLLSFSSWPASSKQQPKFLAEAGFFYAGYSDNVKCFFCDGGLRNWEQQDDPWVEHARWFPRCNFLKQHKGNEFIQQIQVKFGNPVLPAAQEVPGLGQVEMNRGSGQYRNSNILTVNPNQAATNAMTGIEYRVDPREVKARLDTPTVKAVLDMGYSRETVKQCIDQRLRTQGDDFPTAETLLDAIFQMEERLQSQTLSHHAPAPQPAPKSEDVAAQKDQPPAAATPEPAKKSKKKRKKNKKNKKKAEAVNVPETKETKEEEKEEEEEEEEEGEDDIRPTEEEQSILPNDEEAMSLIQENRELKEARTCKVCMDEEVNMVFLPCGHLVCCMNCAPALRKCPICRSLVRGTVRIFLS